MMGKNKDSEKHPKRKAHDLNLDGVTEDQVSEDGLDYREIPNEVSSDFNHEMEAADADDANTYGLALDELDNEGRGEYDLDVDRMINEGLAGGYIRGDRNQISQVHPIQENDEAFSTPEDEV